MLKRLKIKDFALIDDIDIVFFEHLNVLTGETGAGKSIILESLNLLFGKRSDAEMIRHQAKRAIVIGEFVLSDDLSDKYNTRELTIKREIDQSGRHTIKINDEVTTLAKLKEITKEIGMIHSQTDTLSLLDKETYLNFVDMVNEIKIDMLFNDYQIKRSKFLESKKKFDDLKNKRNSNIEKKDFLEFQINELEILSLKENEKEELIELTNKLSNFDRIRSSLLEAHQLLNNEMFDLDNIYNAKKAMDRVVHYDEKYEILAARLNDIYYELSDTNSNINQEISDFDFNEEEFNLMQERIQKIANIENKYQKSANELIKYLNDIKEEYLMITDYDSFLKDLKKSMDNSYQSAYDSALILSKARKENAKKLEDDVLKSLADLDLAKTTFHIHFKETDDLLESGIDDIDFLISLNEGEIEKPLSKVASGGERSRFLFAIKSIFSTQNKLSMLVLDEIDIGISGKTASLVAKKMKELSSAMQLIVITHLPQVAARADHHFGITKVKKDGRMTSLISKLSFDERIESIALMLSDEKLTNHAIEQAKLMLKK
ncbi:DNA repair protein RecN [Acholeplasma sp. OttesenSCG-928-E16]|nr:DNA repair protein RecN [Acholeplasma sp. OttesenSCG-928-E16]